MTQPRSVFRDAYLGSLAADALAMPVHWYYDRLALRREYGTVRHFVAPLPKHTGSILWRSKYEPLNERGDILRGQAKYWGQKDVHYHQFLAAGENTLNFKLAIELYEWLGGTQATYDPKQWLERYVTCMLQDDWHRDTYAEEYHRAFFTNYAKGKPLLACGIEDEHIGGLATVPALIAGLEGAALPQLRRAVQTHVALTHQHEGVLRAADTLTMLLADVNAGTPLRDAMRKHATDWLSPTKAEAWNNEPDEHVIGQRFSPACYIAESMPAALYLAWKYHDSFALGLSANAMVGGDNCHRGAVVGALLGAACPQTATEIAAMHLD
jgi:ADP-ribosyl-[dinitrogen reductase] hydrolase